MDPELPDAVAGDPLLAERAHRLLRFALRVLKPEHDDPAITQAIQCLLDEIDQGAEGVNHLGVEYGLLKVATLREHARYNEIHEQFHLKNTLATILETFAALTDGLDGSSGSLSEPAGRVRLAQTRNELIQAVDRLLTEMRQASSSIHRLQERLLVAEDRAEAVSRQKQEISDRLTEVERMVSMDPLTGAYNRRGLDFLFDAAMRHALRHDSPLTAAIVDIDHFKRFNSDFGHQAGDAALIHFVALLAENLRPTDATARYGGEEFVLICPDTDLCGGEATLARVRERLNAQPCLWRGSPLPLTFSAGLALWAPGESLKDVICRADVALYQAKNGGRDQTVIG